MGLQNVTIQPVNAPGQPFVSRLELEDFGVDVFQAWPLLGVRGHAYKKRQVVISNKNKKKKELPERCTVNGLLRMA